VCSAERASRRTGGAPRGEGEEATVPLR